MPPTAGNVLTIVADDLTGACDTGTLFAARAAVPVTVWPRLPAPSAVRVVDTETRRASLREAGRRVAEVATSLPAASYFKKIDSTLRGRVAAEVDALIRAVGAPGALFTPAFPAQGRTVVERVLLVDGAPIAETAFARDPEFSCPGARTLVDALRGDIGRPLAWVPLGVVREGHDALVARLTRLRGTVAVADAETDGDLSALVDAALALEPGPVLVGAAGLGRALAQRLGLLAARVALPPARRWLVVAGSRHPATRRQIEAARAAGIRVLATLESDVADSGEAAARLAEEACHLLAREAFDLVAVTGGQTALALWNALGADRIDLVGAPAPGLAFGYLRAPRHPALALLTKAGGFGEPDLFVSLRREANA
jgi:uncharacterized protein YgbK (DUF1537 family)